MAGALAVTDGAVMVSVLVRTSSVLLAVRMVAWAGWTDPFMPAVTKVIDRMVQASTTHADLVHVRMVLSLSFRGDQRRTLLGPGAERMNRSGRKGLRRVGPPADRNARSA